MPPSTAAPPLRLTALCAALLLLSATPRTASAAAPDPVAADVHCWKDRHFLIPIADGVPGQNGIREVVLYVSEDYGKTYSRAATAKTGQTRFSVTVGRDGLYYFALQIVGQDGKLYPEDTLRLQPALKVLVKNTPPDIRVSRANP